MSDAEDIARRRRAERERIARENRRAAEEGAQAEEQAGRRLDKQFEQDIKNLLGNVAPGELNDLQNYASGKDLVSIRDAQRAIKRGRTPGQRRKAKRAVKAAKPAIKRAKKKKGWCSLWALILLASMGGAGWALFELAHSLVA